MTTLWVPILVTNVETRAQVDELRRLWCADVWGQHCWCSDDELYVESAEDLCRDGTTRASRDRDSVLSHGAGRDVNEGGKAVRVACDTLMESEKKCKVRVSKKQHVDVTRRTRGQQGVPCSSLQPRAMATRSSSGQRCCEKYSAVLMYQPAGAGRGKAQRLSENARKPRGRGPGTQDGSQLISWPSGGPKGSVGKHMRKQKVLRAAAKQLRNIIHL